MGKVRRAAAVIGLRLIAVTTGLFVLALPVGAKTSAQIVQGSGEFQTLESAITIDSAQDVQVQWSTDEAGAKTGQWRLTNNKNASAPVGDAGPAPQAGHIWRFTIPASNFAVQAKYSITVQARSAASVPLGAASTPATVTRVGASSGGGVTFGDNAKFPDVELVHYTENIGVVPQTQLHFALAKLTVRLVNHSSKPTDALILSASDFNVLMRQNGAGIAVAPLQPNASVVKTINMQAVLPPPQSQMPEEVQYSQWTKHYNDLCGVDLHVSMDWSGPQQNIPFGAHVERDVYFGYGNSRPWDEGAKPYAPAGVCDETQCVSLKLVARAICTALRNKVVGYAFFVGNKTSQRFGAYGLARTSADPPQMDFTPTTKMQIASASKVLTGLATVALLQGQIDTNIFSYLPSDFQSAMPMNHPTRNMKFRELVSQKSGVQQYYAGPNGQDYASLKAFFTQPIATPNAPRFCPGPPRAPDPTVPGDTGVPAVLTNPIIANKSACYTDTNFGLMRILLARFKGGVDTDPQAIADSYVQIVQDKVLKPVGVTADCVGPSGNTALPYTLTPGKPGWDWGNLRLKCGDWGWFLSVSDYAKVLNSLNSGDGKIVNACQLNDVEFNATLNTGTPPDTYPVGFDRRNDGSGHRWLEKNGAEGWDIGTRGGSQTTSVGIFGGKSACMATAVPGVAAVLFINSPVAVPTPPGGKPPNPPGADQILLQALQSAITPKP